MATVETSNQKNLPGVYKHPETGVELIARQHPKFGSAQADGFVASGFVWKGPAPEKASSKKGDEK